MSTKKSEKKDSKKNSKKTTEEVSKPEVKKEVTEKKSKKKQEVETVEETTQAETTQETTKKPRYVATRESVEKEFEELVALINAEVERLRDPKTENKSKGVKFLRTVNKKVKTLKLHALKVAKQKPATKRTNNNSGFLKPVNISSELASFIGSKKDELKSRVDVTRFICKYIKDQELQNPDDKRNILVEKDPKLKKLLNFDTKGEEPLTYYTLQKYLKTHFVPTKKA